MFVHGTRDEVVPFYCSEEMFKRARTKKKLLVIEGGDHFLRRNVKVLEKIAEWLEKEDEGVEKITV